MTKYGEMSKHTSSKSLSPSLAGILATTGSQIKMARLRRKRPRAVVCAESGCSEQTLIRIESGSPNVSMGAYLRVLETLGLQESLLLVAKDDPEGRELQDQAMLKRK